MAHGKESTHVRKEEGLPVEAGQGNAEGTANPQGGPVQQEALKYPRIHRVKVAGGINVREELAPGVFKEYHIPTPVPNAPKA